MESVKLIQPYFVIQTSKFYQEIYLKHGISHFYSFQVESGGEVMTVPDGCVDIIFTYGQEKMEVELCGTVLSQNTFVARDKKDYFGIRFLPGIMPVGLQLGMKEIVGKQVNMRQFPEASEIIQKMEEQDSFEQRIATFLSEYTKVFQNQAKKITENEILKTMNRMIYKTNGRIKIKELEEYTGYTARYLNRVFTEEMGVSPKTFCKIIQFQKTLDYLTQFKEIRLTDVALDFGYYDQSQLVHDFKLFTSVTPKEYKKMVEEKDYNRHILGIGCLQK